MGPSRPVYASATHRAAAVAVPQETRRFSRTSRGHLDRQQSNEPGQSRLTTPSLVTRIMVMSTQSLAAVKAHFSQVIDDVAGTHERVTVTRNGSPVAVILAVEDYESLMETLEILSDRQAVADIREAEQQMAEGQSYDEEQVRAALADRRA
jgi:antitoxin YefM